MNRRFPYFLLLATLFAIALFYEFVFEGIADTLTPPTPTPALVISSHPVGEWIPLSSEPGNILEILVDGTTCTAGESLSDNLGHCTNQRITFRLPVTARTSGAYRLCIHHTETRLEECVYFYPSLSAMSTSLYLPESFIIHGSWVEDELTLTK